MKNFQKKHLQLPRLFTYNRKKASEVIAMDKYYSYADFLKAMGRNQTVSEAEKLLNEIYMDLFLNHVHREQRKDRLLTLIDNALDQKDKGSFVAYTNELCQLQQDSV
jgi:uncharacterized protein YpiB (UPF0302 family)